MKPATTPPQVVRRRLDLTASAVEVLRRVRHRHRPIALIGSWHCGEALICCDPDQELPADADPIWDVLDRPAADGDGTFGGGWIGAWGYRIGRNLEDIGTEPPRPHPQPSHVLGHYRHVLRLDHGVWWAESLGTHDDLAAWLDTIADDLDSPGERLPHMFTEFTAQPGAHGHTGAIEQTLEHIAAGDIFQANVCTRLEAQFSGDPLDAFCDGVSALNPAYAAYVGWDDGALVSLSPELFVRRIGREVLTSPIKGTAPLDTDPDDLVASAKDRAENIMIVDLMRNDLGRVCEPGSVRVPSIARAERHSVWHLVSDVTGTLRPGLTDAHLLAATFPPGSVTGAPKVRAMQIVADVEATAREFYTGAIGYASEHFGLELNVAIRTFEFAFSDTNRNKTTVWLGVGGGIVADSEPSAELAECFTKADPLLTAVGALPLARDFRTPRERVPHHPRESSAPPARDFPSHRPICETLLVIDGEPIDVDTHLTRLATSAKALYGASIDVSELRSSVRSATHGQSGRGRLRIDVTPDPAATSDVGLSLSLADLAPEPGPWQLDVRVMPGGWGAHKWSDRDRLGPSVPGRDSLLIDDDATVLETARGSVFCVRDDGVHTPALDGRILPGTERARVIERLTASGINVYQHRLTTADLHDAHEVFLTNALRGVVPVTAIAEIGSWPVGPIAGLLQNDPQTAPARAERQQPAHVLFIDNYDSFVYNLVQYVGELGATAEVIRNDAAEPDELVRRCAAGEFTHLIISPGPGTPAEAGISAELIARVGPTLPTLGVCLGHQVIAEVFGARVVRAPRVVHGKPSLIHHNGSGVFAGLPHPLTCGRYHSLVVDPASLPDELEVTARTADGVMMGLRHREFDIEGVQMHPESILTHCGHDMVAQFLSRRRRRATWT